MQAGVESSSSRIHYVFIPFFSIHLFASPPLPYPSNLNDYREEQEKQESHTMKKTTLKQQQKRFQI